MVFTIRQQGSGALAKAWDQGVPMESNVWTQVDNLAAVPGVERVAIMPDAHIGMGACVGSAILTHDIIIPAAVGVDIGCGMAAAPLTVTRSALHDLPALRHEIEKRIPVGRTNNGQAGDRGAWGVIPQGILNTWRETLYESYLNIVAGYPKLEHQFVVNHLGTLGTGNHFVEICVEQEVGDDPRLWIMLHSGSRGIGNKIGVGFTKLAQQEMERWHIKLPEPELAYLPRGTKLFDDYLAAANWAQKYAWTSREIMFWAVVDALHTVVSTSVNVVEDALVHCHHNYVAQERHFGKVGYLTRKGAVNAAAGVMGIIPGSMGTRSYITRGLGNPESLMTSSHGAGRVMSRNVARKTITMEQHLAAIQGVECRLDADVVDESPAAYKDIDAVMAAQADLTEPIVTLKQIVCVKG